MSQQVEKKLAMIQHAGTKEHGNGTGSTKQTFQTV